MKDIERLNLNKGDVIEINPASRGLRGKRRKTITVIEPNYKSSQPGNPNLLGVNQEGKKLSVSGGVWIDVISRFAI